MAMPEYMNKEVFLSSMGLTGDETKYGNRDAEHQHRSYSTYMSYEIMDSVDDSIVEEELAPVRHGRLDDEHKCTVCHNEAFYKISNIRPDYDYDWEENLVETGDYIWDIEWVETAYCPNCGAIMDGERI